MQNAKKAVGSVVEGVKKVAIGEKKQKVKKEKGGDGGADAGMEFPPSSTDFIC